MSDKYPYVVAPGNLVQTITQMRKSFPTILNADTLKKLAIAPQNESYVLNSLRFLGLINEEGKRSEQAAKIFSLHDDAAFSKAFADVIKKRYSPLFELHGEESWKLDRNHLVTFFRQSDQTSAIVGGRQAMTFETLAAFSGHGEFPASKQKSVTAKGKGADKKMTPKATAPKVKVKDVAPPAPPAVVAPAGTVGLTVRIEINLPANGDQETYNNIFRSIRENLLNE